VTCGYELQGLSIRDLCPECGTAVRASILHLVDPLADALAPMRSPKLTAVCVVAWAATGLVGMLLLAADRAGSMATSAGWDVGVPVWLLEAGMLFAVLSGLSMVGLVAPTRATRQIASFAAVASLLAYLPILLAIDQIGQIDALLPAPYLSGTPTPERLWWRIGLGASMAVVYLGFRPNARELVRRTLVLRTGRVDRQTLLAMAGAALLGVIGDGLRLASLSTTSTPAFVLDRVGSLLILVSSLFLILGMASATVDGLRISRAIRLGPRSLRDIIRSPSPPVQHADSTTIMQRPSDPPD